MPPTAVQDDADGQETLARIARGSVGNRVEPTGGGAVSFCTAQLTPFHVSTERPRTPTQALADAQEKVPGLDHG